MKELTRYENWTSRWATFIKDSLDLRYDLKLDWEVINCIQFVAQGIYAITGVDFYEEDKWDGKFDSALSAGREIRRRGFDTLDEVVAYYLPEIPLAFAWPGDVVLIKSDFGDSEVRKVMPHGVALVDHHFYYAVGEDGMGRGDLYKDAVKAFGVGHVV